MKKLFVDTGAFVARAIAADNMHHAAESLWRKWSVSNVQLVSTEHVFDETMTLLSRHVGYPYAAQWGELHLQSKAIDWVVCEKPDLLQALVLMKKYADQSISFTDCVSFHCMRKLNIKDVFGFDRHFRLAGFRLHSE